MDIRNRDYILAKKQIEEIASSKDRYVVICYTCENESNNDYKEPSRITSIVVRRLDNKQVRTFSLLEEFNSQKGKGAQKGKIDTAEKIMLQRFFEYAERECNEKIWLHWRMYDSNYGFLALENRYFDLGGIPFTIPQQNRIDICGLLKKRYGNKFVKKEKWRIEYLAKKNQIETAGFLGIDDEAKTFKEKNYKKLLDSPLRKTSIFLEMLDLSAQNRLKTDSHWWEIHGSHLQGIYDTLKDKWWFHLVIFILGAVLGAIFGIFIK